MPEDLWKTNVDWVAETFAPYGYRMVCTDGWCDKTTVVTEHGYIRSFQDDWTHDWAWWAKYLKSKGLELGVYYNPLWTTRSTVADPSVTVVGRPDIKVADIVNPGDYQSAGSDPLVGGRHPGRGRGVRQGVRGLLPASWGPPSCASTSWPGTSWAWTRARGPCARPTAARTTSRLCPGCARRPATCSSAW